MNGHGRRRRLDEIHRVADALREPVRAPDLTDAILARVRDEQPFLSARARLLADAGRAGLVLCVLIGIGGLALAYRFFPQATALRQRPAPFSCVVDCAQDEAAARFVRLRSAIGAVASPARVTQDLVIAPTLDPSQGSTASTAVRTVDTWRPVHASVALIAARGCAVADSSFYRRVEAGLPFTPSAWDNPPWTVRPVGRDLLDDFAPIISGQSVGDGLLPR